MESPREQLEAHRERALAGRGEDHEATSREPEQSREGHGAGTDTQARSVLGEAKQRRPAEDEERDEGGYREHRDERGGVALKQGHACEGDGGKDSQGAEVDERLGEHRAGHHREGARWWTLQAPVEHDDPGGLADAPREDRRGHHADHRGARDGRPRDAIGGERCA